MPCRVPVVFLIFCRPDLTARVFDLIRQAQPEQLYVVADGPRTESETELCKRAREVTEVIDWPCIVHRNYSEVNLGCRKRVFSGLSWVFHQVEEAIVLEDDCLPHLDFFRFCSDLLEYYRHEKRIFSICGSNFQDGVQRGDSSVYFSAYADPWGWATWRRAWRRYTENLESWPDFRDAKGLSQILNNAVEVDYWNKIFNDLYYQGVPDSWFYGWLLTCWLNGGVSIWPNVSLVSNIGFGVDATHCKGGSKFANQPTHGLGEIRCPGQVQPDKAADQYLYLYRYEGKVLAEKKKFGVLYPWLLRLRAFRASPLKYMYSKAMRLLNHSNAQNG